MSGVLELPDVRLPAIEVAPGDAGTVRQVGTWLAGASAGLGQVAWRLRAGSAAMQTAGHWCGTASTAYQAAVAARCDQVDRAGLALQVAGQACTQYAAEIETAQEHARAAAREAEHLVRQRDELDLAWRRFEAERAARTAALASPVQAGELFGAAPAAMAEQRRLHGWAERIAASAARVGAEGEAASRSARDAAATAARAFDEVVALTTAARVAAVRARHDAMVDAQLLPAEDGSFGSRAGGLFDALRDDVVAPLDLIGGLLGAGGDIGAHWAQLGEGIEAGVTHPGQLLGTVFDLSDARQGDWGHWLGTVGPGVLLSAGSAGTYAVARGLRSADLLASSARVGDELRRAQELLDLADAARFRFTNGGSTSSRLVPGGGLTAHELAGGHLLARHIGKDLAGLRSRLSRYPVLHAASTFHDRYTAEQTVAEGLDREAAKIAGWLGGTAPDLPLIVDMHRVVGVTLRRGSPRPTEATRVKLVLLRDPASPLGFTLLTAFPYA